MRVRHIYQSILFIICIISSQVNVSAQNNEVIDLETLEVIESLSKIIYVKLVTLDNNGVNITLIVSKLNKAHDYYQEAQNDSNKGYSEEFITYVSNYIEFLRNIEDDVDLLISNVESEKNSNILKSLSLSALYIVLGYISWKFIVKSNEKNILKLKPMVSNNEFE